MAGDKRRIPDSRPPNFDPFARAYRWMEYFTFGTILEQCRFQFLQECCECRQALILGDGDGRFTARLFAANAVLRADAIDLSPAMLDQLMRRVECTKTDCTLAQHPGEKRLRTICADVRHFSPEAAEYDLIVSHFLLDCLTDRDVEDLLRNVIPRLAPKSLWLISEFSVPEKGWRRMAARLLIHWLYFFFRKTTHLQVRQIPDYAAALTSYGFRCRQRASFLGGILSAEIWERMSFSRNS
jgi:cyclopropane fatty-acyl-phospholipid synthase-like methyltransferase